MNIKLLKLVTGEEIMRDISQSPFEADVRVKKPMSLARHQEKGLVIMKYAPFSKDEIIDFKPSAILHISNPIDALTENYIQSTQEPSRIIAPSTNIIV